MPRPATLAIVPAMSTPLASIFGSGFLVIVPVLASSVGPYSLWAMLAVAFVAFHTGAVVRHNILCAEPVLAAGSQRLTLTLERLSDGALVLAYIVSVCLYIHILSAFVLGAFGLDSGFNKSLFTTLVIGVITAIGIMGGLRPLERMERWALYVTILVLAVLLAAFALRDISDFLDTGRFVLPSMPQRSGWEMVTMVAGTLIVVQGFETSRFLGDQHPAEERIASMRFAQLGSSAIYVVFIGLAMVLVAGSVPDASVTAIVKMVGPVAAVLPFFIVIAAVGSQFSAAVADDAGCSGLLSSSLGSWLPKGWAFALTGGAAIALNWLTDVMSVLAYASRAFAVYYTIQCAIAVALAVTREDAKGRWWMIPLGSVLALVALSVAIFGIPAEG